MVERENERNPSVETAVRPRVKTSGRDSSVVELDMSDMLIDITPGGVARAW
jgi:hypothetical protein